MMWTLALLSTATAADVTLEPGSSIQDAINDAAAGDTITLSAGTYEEDLSTETHGTAEAPITLTAAEDADVIITASGEVLQVDHAYWIIEGITFDGQYGNADTLDIGDAANHTRLENIEVRNSARDCIDMGAPQGIQISNSSIHHCLYFDTDDGERLDAHGITGGAVRDLRIENTDIHTFSGDAIQFDAGRAAPGWNDIHIEGCRFWLEPLDEDTAGFLVGQVTGENAVDTKTWNEADEANLTIVDTEAWGFKNGLDISNQAAFLFKENVKVTLKRVRVHDSEIAFRLRGPTSARPKGATVHMENILVYGVDVGIRYEDELNSLTIWHATFGSGIGTLFQEADSESTDPNIQNSLFLIDVLPEEVDTDQANLLASNEDFVDADEGDHRLVETSNAIDAGTTISGISTDIDGLDRVVGPAPDVGAHEYGVVVVPDTGDADTGESGEEDGDGGGGPDEPDDTAAPTDDREDVGGIGAAEQVGEKGGCGCSTQPIKKSPFALVLLLALGIARRRKKNSTAQRTA